MKSDISYPLEHLRQTGRTTSMLQQALKFAKRGKTVYVVAAGLVQRDIYKDRYRLMVKKPKIVNCFRVDKVFFITVNVADKGVKMFDWDTWTIRGVPKCEVLVDHCAIEMKYKKALAELHRFDLTD